ncbi:MAG: hypothetical protein ABFS56_26225 [Pseudomonadota bacterium]
MLKTSLIIILLSTTLKAQAFNCSTVTQIPLTECEILVTLYNSTNGENWTRNSGWLETNAPCGWYGVTCNGGHVSELDLGYYKGTYGNNLTGTIPSEIWNLTNLQSLYLYSNQLTGIIPSELGNGNMEIIQPS